MTLKSDVNPWMEVALNKVKSDWVQVPIGRLSVLTVGW